MRHAHVALLFALATAGCLWLADEAPAEEPEARTWHLSSDVVYQEGFCGDCHYGLTEFWLADWSNDGGNWSLRVAPRFAEAPLYGVHVGSDLVVEAVPWQSAPWSQGDTQIVTFEVDGGSHVFFKSFGKGPDQDALALTATNRDVVNTTLVLVDPDGTAHEAMGPEQDLRIVTAPAINGTWEARITFVDAPLPDGSVWWSHEILAGDAVGHIAWGDEATWTFPAGPDGAPPEVALRLHPHHDHAPFQNTEWDTMDSTPFEVHYQAQNGTAPAPVTWNASTIDALWDGPEYRFHQMAGSFQGAYLDEPGHNDPGFGSDYPHFGSPDADPVLPGTSKVRFELTWEPPIDVPGLRVKFSPANWPYFIVPEASEREPGRAVFEASIQPAWWEDPEQTLEWYEPGVVRSYYDIAPFIEEDGEAHVVSIDYRLDAYAVR